MPIDYSVNALIENIKRRITVPQSQNFFLPSNIVVFANDSMHSDIVPIIVSVREEFFVSTKDIEITHDVNEYRFPWRTIAGSIRNVSIVDSNGNEFSLPRLQPELTSRVGGIVIEDDKIKLIPNSWAGKKLRFKYIRRPNNLVLNSMAAKITEINWETNQLVLSNIPPYWLSLPLKKIDIIRSTPLFTSVIDDCPVLNINGFVITLGAKIPPETEEGLWVAESGQSPVPQIPYEAHHVLAQFTAGRMLESIGDRQNAEIVFITAYRMKENLIDILTPRIESSPQKINSTGGIFCSSGG